MNKLLKTRHLFLLGLLVLGASCTKKTYTSDVYVRKEWKIFMSAGYTVPANTGRTDHAVAVLTLMDNSVLYYDVYFDVAPNNSDTPTGVQLYTGNAAENGTLTLDLKNGAFAGNEVKGNITLDAATITKLLGSNIYMQVNSSQKTSGLVRGQIDKTINGVYDVDLTAYSASVNTTATGKAYLRVMSDNTLAYQVAVSNLPASDALTLAHIHKTADNSLQFTLAASAADFNKGLTLAITAANATSISNDNLYVDVHSSQYPNGLLKGTIR